MSHERFNFRPHFSGKGGNLQTVCLRFGSPIGQRPGSLSGAGGRNGAGTSRFGAGCTGAGFGAGAGLGVGAGFTLGGASGGAAGEAITRPSLQLSAFVCSLCCCKGFILIVCVCVISTSPALPRLALPSKRALLG